MKFHIIKLINLQEDLENLKNVTDRRYITILLNIYAEHFVNDFVRLVGGELAEKYLIKSISFPEKLGILKEKNIIDNNEKIILSSFYNIRNKIVHNLIVNPKNITDIFNGSFEKHTKIFGSVINDNPFIKELFEPLDIFQKFKVSMIWLIYKLWLRFQKVYKRYVKKTHNEDIDIEEKIELIAGEDKQIYVKFFELKKDIKDTK